MDEQLMAEVQELSELPDETLQELLDQLARDTGAHLLPTQDTDQLSLHLVQPEAQDSTSSLEHGPLELPHASPPVQETSVGDAPGLLQNPAPSAHNTKRSTRMAVVVWTRWCTNEGMSESSILGMPEDELKELMARFIREIKKKDGTEYSSRSLRSVVGGIQRHLRERNPTISFFDQGSPTYSLVRKALKEKLAVVTPEERTQDQVVLTDTEKMLWEKGTFTGATSDHEGLTNTIVWYNLKLFGLKSAAKQRQLERSQYAIAEDESGEYLTFSFKPDTHHGSGQRRQNRTSVVKVRARAELGEKCAVHCFKQYLSLIPEEGPLYPPTSQSSATHISLHKMEGIVRNVKQHLGVLDPSKKGQSQGVHDTAQRSERTPTEVNAPDDESDIGPPPPKKHMLETDHEAGKENTKPMMFFNVVQNMHITLAFNGCSTHT